MYAVFGITGQVGGQVARTLLAARQPVRAIVRNPQKAQSWSDLGCELAVADILDPDALAAAFRGAQGVFILVPPVFDPAPGFPEARAIAESLRTALRTALPGRIVYLSTIGADATQTNLLTQHTLIEDELRRLPLPITYLRAGWFMENYAWDVASVVETGLLHSFLQPLDRPIAMVATADIGSAAAQLLQTPWTGHRIVNLEGPERLSPNRVARAFAQLLGRPVAAQAVPRETWESLFLAQGMKNPAPRIQMVDGFNQGWIDFNPATSRKGLTSIDTVIAQLVNRNPNA